LALPAVAAKSAEQGKGNLQSAIRHTTSTNPTGQQLRPMNLAQRVVAPTCWHAFHWPILVISIWPRRSGDADNGISTWRYQRWQQKAQSKAKAICNPPYAIRHPPTLPANKLRPMNLAQRVVAPTCWHAFHWPILVISIWPRRSGDAFSRGWQWGQKRPQE